MEGTVHRTLLGLFGGERNALQRQAKPASRTGSIVPIVDKTYATFVKTDT
jgi:hypothetical protein